MNAEQLLEELQDEAYFIDSLSRQISKELYTTKNGMRIVDYDFVHSSNRSFSSCSTEATLCRLDRLQEDYNKHKERYDSLKADFESLCCSANLKRREYFFLSMSVLYNMRITALAKNHRISARQAINLIQQAKDKLNQIDAPDS